MKKEEPIIQEKVAVEEKKSVVEISSAPTEEKKVIENPPVENEEKKEEVPQEIKKEEKLELPEVRDDEQPLTFSNLNKNLDLLDEKFTKNFNQFKDSKEIIKDSADEKACISYLQGKSIPRSSPYKREAQEPTYQYNKYSPGRYKAQDDAFEEGALDDAIMKQEFWEKKGQEASLKSLSPQRLDYQPERIKKSEKPYGYEKNSLPKTGKYY